MKTFSVLTVSKRTGWEEGALSSIGRQTAQPGSWVIVTEKMIDILPDDESIIVLSAPEHTRVSNLCASLNEGLRYITSDYVIFYQDFIDLPPDCFQKLLSLANEHTFVTTCTPNYDGSNDGRYTGCGMPRPCRASEWESNVAIAPMKMVKLLGGFDEEYDDGWAWDNVNLAERAEMLGAQFICDESNRPKLFPHEQSSKLNMVPNGDRHAWIMREIREGIRPITTGYLDGHHGLRP